MANKRTERLVLRDVSRAALSAASRPADAASVAPQRLDQWLWFARFAKSRTLAQTLIARGKVRLNRLRIEKVAQTIKPGDVVTITLGARVRIIQIDQMGVRRGPAVEASKLFTELTPVADRTSDRASLNSHQAQDAGSAFSQGVREAGAGRPTKRERRQTERLKYQLD